MEIALVFSLIQRKNNIIKSSESKAGEALWYSHPALCKQGG